MDVLHDLNDQLPDAVAVAATIGVFDGVHLGHRAVFARVREVADDLGVATAVVTFDGHPAHVVRPESAPKLLTTLDQKLELLEAEGLDYAYVVHFDESRSQTPPAVFVEQVFIGALHARAIVVGEDFHFGKGRSGDVESLRALGREWGFEVHPLDLVALDGEREPISSTAIRRALAGGEVADAARMLGRPYEVRGVVVEGDRRGRTIGFATANVAVAPPTALPADGVYAAWAGVDGERHGCAVNIGRRPTFHEHAEESLLEAHLLDFDGDLYGRELRVGFVEFLRGERRFAGVDQLVEQLRHDVAETRVRLGRPAAAGGPS